MIYLKKEEMMNQSQLEEIEYIKIPRYNSKTGKWGLRKFRTRDEFRDYVDSMFKEPGLYNFDSVTRLWNEHGRNFFKNGYYSAAPKDTKDYIRFWEAEKIKCRRGVIFDDFFLPKEYYMWINFLKIYNKKERKFTLPTIWDVQYHMALYELRCELHYKHAAILKKRQIASSYYHMAKIINLYWFEEGAICKVGASKENYVNDTWKMANEYRDHLNQTTAWYRNQDPNKLRDWQQRQKIIDEQGRESYIGLKSIMKGTTFDKDPTAGVGGPCSIFFHEEGGIAPRADMTLQFMEPALKSGAITTGLFVIAGSVGDLSQCGPLERFVRDPAKYGMLPVPYNLDPKDKITESGLFLPQHWSMEPFIDEFGNSLVEAAKEFVLNERKQWEKDLSLREYQTKISQHPLTIEEAFRYKEESIFPTAIIARRIEELERNGKNYVTVQLDYDDNGYVAHKIVNKEPILEWPVDVKRLDKEGVIQVFNGAFPDKDNKFGVYTAGIDPVDVGKTNSSDSLFSIYIYKTLIEHTTIDSNNQKSVKLEGDEMVACWTGRFDDVNHTNEQAELLLEWYNAWGACENNIKSFIQHMMKKKKVKYLATPKDLPFVKEITAQGGTLYEYGVRMTKALKDYIIEGIIDYLREEIGEISMGEGKKPIIIHGVKKIHDIMLLKEMMGYTGEENVDRIISFGLALAFAKARQANGMYVKKLVHETPPKPVNKNPERQMFNSIFGFPQQKRYKPIRGFKNLR